MARPEREDRDAVNLIEELPIDVIEEFFAERGLLIFSHQVSPRRPDASSWRRLPREIRRRLTSEPTPTDWVDLRAVGGETVHRWYGSGSSPNEALRSAARRYRVEQLGTDRCRR